MRSQLLSQRAYARHRGVTHRAVQKAIEAGRIPVHNGRIDPAEADRAWLANTNPAMQRDVHIPGLRKSRAQREHYRAELLRIELEKREAALIDVDVVRAAIARRVLAARGLLVTIPDRVVPLLLGQTDVHEIHRIITAEVRRVCREIATAAPE